MSDELVAHYRLEEKILDGPTGPLYRARDTRHDRTVALKIIPAGLGEDAAARQSFIEEVRAAGNLGNPAIPAVHDVGESPDGRLFVALEFTEGQTLRSKLASGPLPLPQAISMATQIARALAAAHAKGIVHRDIQPGTVLVDKGGTAKLLDFGLSRLFGAAAQTRTAEMSGDDAYLAPELLQGQEIDTRADIWSVGALLSESLGGKRGKVPEELRWVVDRCRRNNPRERYGSATELADDLESVAAGLDKGTLKNVKLHAAPWQPRRWAMAGAIAGAAVVIAAVLVVTLWWKPWLPRTAERVTIVLLPVVPEGLSDDDMLDEMLTDGLSTDLTKIRQFRVISQSSARTIGAEESISEVARKLNVDYVLKGRARRDGDQVKLGLGLWQVEPEQLTWEQEIAGADEALDALESTAAAEVARRAGVRVTTEDRARLATRPAVKREAYELYLKAMALEVYNPDSNQRILEYLAKAVEIDPTFAEAYAMMLTPLQSLGTPEADRKAREALQRAEELDPRNPRVVINELTTEFVANPEEVIIRLEEVVAANPDDAYAWSALSNCSAYYGKVERALEAGKEAVRLDPVSLWSHFNYCWACLNGRRWDEGVAAFERFIELFPESWLALGNYGMHLTAMGRYEEALEYLVRNCDISGEDPAENWGIAAVYACMGDEKRARTIAAIMRRKFEQDPVGAQTPTVSYAVGLVIIHCCLGETDEALRWLEEVAAIGVGAGLNWQIFYYDPIRELPEAIELARRAGAFEWTLRRIEPVWSPPILAAGR